MNPPPAPAPTSVEVRPPEGLARGRYPVPSWVVISAALTLVVGALVFTAHRRRARKTSMIRPEGAKDEKVR